MEKDELKIILKSRLESTGQFKFDSEKIKEIIMRTTNVVTELNYTNKKWWKAIKTLFLPLAGLLIINIIMFFTFPERFQHIKNPFAFFSVIGIFVILSLVFFYFQLKIFEVSPDGDVKSVLQRAIKQFNKYYLIQNIIYALLFPVLFFYVQKVLFELFGWSVSSNMILLISILLTVLSLIVNHIYYSKKYFPRIAVLKRNLEEYL